MTYDVLGEIIYSKMIYKPCYDTCYDFTLQWLLEIELRVRYKMVRKSKDPHYYLINESGVNESRDQIKASRKWIKQMGN